MPGSLSRRSFLMSGSAVIVPRLAAGMQQAGGPVDPARPAGVPSATFPTQDPDLVREMVSVSHGNVKRVKELVGYVKSLNIKTPCLDFALEVEKVTSVKKDNLILNVDGTMAAVLVDIGFPVDSLNGFFILSRTIGLIGHWVDQKRQDSRLIRLFDYLVNYAAPKRREVPPLK